MAKHGGAWKVAYADFITAMMALFMVLWILGSEQDLLEQMQEYFLNPPTPWDREAGKYFMNVGEFAGIKKQGDMDDNFFEQADPTVLKGIIDSLYEMLKIDAAQGETPPVEIILTAEGLRMMIYDRQDTPMFVSDGTELTEWGDFLLQNLAWLLSRYHFGVVIEGHTSKEAMPNATADYGPWELSADRANRVRRTLEFYAGGEVGISRVTGYGPTKPLEGGEGDGRTNQRITLSLSLEQPLKGEDVPENPTE